MTGPESFSGNYRQDEMDQFIAQKQAGGSGVENAGDANIEKKLDITDDVIEKGLAEAGMKLSVAEANTSEGMQMIIKRSMEIAEELEGNAGAYQNFTELDFAVRRALKN